MPSEGGGCNGRAGRVKGEERKRVKSFSTALHVPLHPHNTHPHALTLSRSIPLSFFPLNQQQVQVGVKPQLVRHVRWLRCRRVPCKLWRWQCRHVRGVPDLHERQVPVWLQLPQHGVVRGLSNVHKWQVPRWLLVPVCRQLRRVSFVPTRQGDKGLLLSEWWHV